MGSVVEAVVPSRLGHSFRWLLASSWTNDLGDGIALAAGPLLVAGAGGELTSFVIRHAPRDESPSEACSASLRA